jgi:hypothetical protein
MLRDGFDKDVQCNLLPCVLLEALLEAYQRRERRVDALLSWIVREHTAEHRRTDAGAPGNLGVAQPREVGKPFPASGLRRRMGCSSVTHRVGVWMTGQHEVK